jgi:hypothetical protein
MATRYFDDDGRTYAFLDSGKLVLTDVASAQFKRSGRLDLSGNLDLIELPEGLRVDQLFLRGCTRLTRLPDRLDIKLLSLADCTGIATLPPGLTCDTLNLQRTRLRTLPGDLRVSHRLDLTDCRELSALPTGLRVGWPDMPRGTPTGGALILRRCTALESLPDDLDVCYLDIRGCTNLFGWPQRAKGRVGRLLAAGCSSLRFLPAWLNVSRLDITDCVHLRKLPQGLRVASEIEIANTKIHRLPASLREVRLRWRGVPIDHRIAFQPRNIRVDEILAESNSALRHVLLERFGLERFFSEANAQVIDTDRDAGGERKLLRVPIAGDEDLVCVLVHCPSTGRRYILRVPPTMKTCREAIAWTAGFDNPDLYHPLVET